jgi:hypothetical protein
MSAGKENEDLHQQQQQMKYSIVVTLLEGTLLEQLPIEYSSPALPALLLQ